MKLLGLAVCAVCAAFLAVGTAAAADQPKAQIRGVNDRALRQAIIQAVGVAKASPQSRFEARRRAASAVEDVVAVLRSQGFYEYQVTPGVGEGDQPTSVVSVATGPQFVFAAPKIEWAGAPPEANVALAGEASIGLTLGRPGRAADVLAAEGRIIAALQKRGYADAKVDPRAVVVDHADHTVQPTFRIAAGRPVRMDGVRVTRPVRSRPGWIRSLAPWKPGAIYDPDHIAQLERRLRETGVYQSVDVALSAQANADGLRPVDVSLIDRPRSTLDLGASYSTAEGSGVDARWIRYDRLGLGDTLTFAGQWANILSKGEIDLSLPDFSHIGRTLKLSGTVYYDDTNAYLERGARVSADVQQHFGKSDVTDLGISLDVTRDQEPNVVNNILVTDYRSLLTVTTLGSIAFDHSDDLLNPKRGWRLSFTAEPTASFGDGPIAYVRAQAQATGYLPFDASGDTDLAARVHVGTILAGNIPGVPASRRFYAGGGGSVRGYAYQDVGPRFPNNSPEGGLSLLESSVELRQQVYGPFAAVAFVDSGVLGTRQYFDLSTVYTGVGFGIRYNLGFAPFRADIAFPLDRRTGDSAFQIYLSIGQSF